MEKPVVDIYTDGACSGNPGKGGFGIVLRYKNKDGKFIEKEISKGFKKTTNNRMELLAAIIALETLKTSCNVNLCSDSKYLIDAIKQKWLDSWKKNNWKTSSKKAVKNIDLWKRLLLMTDKHSINWIWVKGHDGHEFNERCDKLAVLAYNSDDLEDDTGYVE